MNGTQTSSFGVSKRENHNSEKFYSSKLYSGYNKGKVKEYRENPIPKSFLSKIFCKSSEDMSELPDESIHLMVTSPPYNVGKTYDKDLSLEEYLRLLKNVLKETHRVMVNGGRVCINIANVGRKPYIPLHSYIIQIMHDLGFLMRGEIIWDKSASAGTSTAWGSFKSATNPTLRDVHEYILIFSKEDYSRLKNGKRDTIEKEEFLEYTKSIWAFPAASARRIGHPAPFPIELPLRLIKFYTFEGDVVLDPFMGSGQTAIAAMKSGRNYEGYETNKEYCQLAQNETNKEYCQLAQRRIKEITEQRKLTETV
ncbi:site-specific DNA-methyltransferase [Candidatus Woesearchaeota archaeon]|nr:site-specific DNA-methyltransferase [Candidatus Woesearchaeota archaeon]